MIYLERDSDGKVSQFEQYQPGYSPTDAEGTPVTQAKIDVYELGKAKAVKKTESEQAWKDFLKLGIVYGGNTFSLYRYSDLTNLNMKMNLSSSAPDKYQYDDENGISIDFVDTAGLILFIEFLNDEWDRCIRKKIQYKKDIKACNSISDPANLPRLDQITIDYSA